ncbi:MAG TPA: metalloregulator ArsR/SmtB family transcription factor [Gemmatimonadales bacterium]|nr:metalloregulator ArsR/SmtB family transcription factor [Gemmatimonadales bacterium]
MVQYSAHLDRAFAAVSDPIRRGILGRLGHGDASISDLASSFDMTLTGMKKHVRILEEAGLVTTEKVGRVRTCRLGRERLAPEAAWMRSYVEMVEARFNRLERLLERTKGETS